MSMSLSAAWTSPVLPSLPEGTVSHVAVDALMPAAAALGVLLGWLLLETIGRRAAMGLAGVLFLAGWMILASATPPRYYLIYPGRVVSGLATGLVNIASTIYIAEISPVSNEFLFSYPTLIKKINTELDSIFLKKTCQSNYVKYTRKVMIL